jgi:hypothetical protein
MTKSTAATAIFFNLSKNSLSEVSWPSVNTLFSLLRPIASSSAVVIIMLRDLSPDLRLPLLSDASSRVPKALLVLLKSHISFSLCCGPTEAAAKFSLGSLVTSVKLSVSLSSFSASGNIGLRSGIMPANVRRCRNLLLLILDLESQFERCVDLAPKCVCSGDSRNFEPARRVKKDCTAHTFAIA